jgi:hypothetical protein
VERGGKGYHPDCHAEKFGLRCAICKGLIQGAYFQHEGRSICEQDYRASFAPRCYHCGEVLQGTFKENAHGQRACRRHEQAPRCASCERWLEPQDQGLLARATFGTVLCPTCRPTAVGAQEVQAYGMAFGVAALRELGLDLGPTPAAPIQLGTLAGVDALKGPLDQVVHGITRTEVTALNGVVTARTLRGITLVGGLARDHFEGVLAHEFGHVWLFQQHLDQLPAQRVEGFCELVRSRWLARLGSPLALDQLRGIQENPHPIYGEGFRLLRSAWEGGGTEGLRSALGG